MRRLVSSILILVILASQGLCIAHAHSEIGSKYTGVAAVRPHFHVHGSHSHKAHDHLPGHHHRQKPALPVVTEPCPLHDADAFYVADSVGSVINRSSTPDAKEWLFSDLTFGVNGFGLPLENSALDIRPDWPCRWSIARVPLFLQRLAIRC